MPEHCLCLLSLLMNDRCSYCWRSWRWLACECEFILVDWTCICYSCFEFSSILKTDRLTLLYVSAVTKSIMYIYLPPITDAGALEGFGVWSIHSTLFCKRRLSRVNCSQSIWTEESWSYNAVSNSASRNVSCHGPFSNRSPLNISTTRWHAVVYHAVKRSISRAKRIALLN